MTIRLLIAAVLSLLSVGVASAKVDAANVPVCASEQLKVAARHVGAAGGTAGGYLSFRNVGRSACRMSGWPTVIAVTADRRAIPAVRRRSTMFGPTLHSSKLPVVVLQPGQRAEAVFTVSDNPGPGQTTCAVYHSLRVTAPGGTHSVVLSTWFASLDAWLSACSSVWLSMVVPAADLHKG